MYWNSLNEYRSYHFRRFYEKSKNNKNIERENASNLIVYYQMKKKKKNARTHQLNGKELSYFWLIVGHIFSYMVLFTHCHLNGEWSYWHPSHIFLVQFYLGNDGNSMLYWGLFSKGSKHIMLYQNKL